MLLKIKGRTLFYALLTIIFLLILARLRKDLPRSTDPTIELPLQKQAAAATPLLHDKSPSFDWASREQHNPITAYEPIPAPAHHSLPPIQHVFGAEDAPAKRLREQRKAAVKEAFVRCWQSYRQYAWLQDELTPVSASYRSTFGGWAATLVDSLDTLWIMDLKDDFNDAVAATLTIDFSNTTSERISLFETNIRYLGGLLSAYDLSSDDRLLRKALELANTLWAAFDTPNRMPINRWNLQGASEGWLQEAEKNVLSAEIGSLSMEFTHLAQLTGDMRWYDAIARIMDTFHEQQDHTNLPGMWPLVVNARDKDFSSGHTFTLGAMADSLYEYLPKMHALLSGGSDLYAAMYQEAMEAAIKHTLYRPMLPDNADVLIAGSARANGSSGVIILEPSGQHLGCFVGGMLALGGRLIGNQTHIALGRKVTDGCVWTYEHSQLGVMPESFAMLPCSDQHHCAWSEDEWLNEIARRAEASSAAEGAIIADKKGLLPGFTSIDDRRYILRPEAIESVFILYRITGDPQLMEQGFAMWQSIDKHTKTSFANSAIDDMTVSPASKSDSMESFWTAETLKYFYLLFSEPSLINLDEYVFNTEAHPFRRAVPG